MLKVFCKFEFISKEAVRSGNRSFFKKSMNLDKDWLWGQLTFFMVQFYSNYLRCIRWCVLLIKAIWICCFSGWIRHISLQWPLHTVWWQRVVWVWVLGRVLHLIRRSLVRPGRTSEFSGRLRRQTCWPRLCHQWWLCQKLSATFRWPTKREHENQ